MAKAMFRRKPLVWLIDDDAALLRLLEHHLSRRDLIVSTFQEPTKALLRLQSSRPDLVVVDMYLDGIDGISVASNFRAAGYQGMIIMLTATDEFGSRSGARVVGIDTIMIKPPNYDMIASLANSASSNRKTGLVNRLLGR